MLPFGVTIQATVPQRSEIPEVLMNYPVKLRLEDRSYVALYFACPLTRKHRFGRRTDYVELTMYEVVLRQGFVRSQMFVFQLSFHLHSTFKLLKCYIWSIAFYGV